MYNVSGRTSILALALHGLSMTVNGGEYEVAVSFQFQCNLVFIFRIKQVDEIAVSSV